MGIRKRLTSREFARTALVVVGVIALLGLVPVRAATGAGVFDDAEGPGPTELVSTLQAQFTVDPVARTMAAVPLGGVVDTLGAAGETVSSSSVPMALSADPLPAPAGAGSSSCSVEGNSASEVHEYDPTYAYFPQPYDGGVYMQYQFTTFQLDNARQAGTPEEWKRQYIQCVAGGGHPRTGAQARNGGGTAMEDSTPRMLLPCNPSGGYGCAWGNGLDSSDPPKTVATLDFEIIGGEDKKATVKGGVSIPITTGGGGWTGAQGPLPSSALRDDAIPSQFEVNEVNGWWYSGGETTNYRGNTSQGLWEYPMSDTTTRTIRGVAWMRHHCGFFGCDKTTYYPAAPQTVGGQGGLSPTTPYDNPTPGGQVVGRMVLDPGTGPGRGAGSGYGGNGGYPSRLCDPYLHHAARNEDTSRALSDFAISVEPYTCRSYAQSKLTAGTYDVVPVPQRGYCAGATVSVGTIEVDANGYGSGGPFRIERGYKNVCVIQRGPPWHSRDHIMVALLDTPLPAGEAWIEPPTQPTVLCQGCFNTWWAFFDIFVREDVSKSYQFTVFLPDGTKEGPGTYSVPGGSGVRIEERFYGGCPPAGLIRFHVRMSSGFTTEANATQAPYDRNFCW